MRKVTSSNQNKTYKAGEQINILIRFNEEVIVNGTPSLELNLSSEVKNATYFSGNGTSTLQFTYEVQSTDRVSDLDYVSSSSLNLNGGNISSAIGNKTAVLTLPSKIH